MEYIIYLGYNNTACQLILVQPSPAASPLMVWPSACHVTWLIRQHQKTMPSQLPNAISLFSLLHHSVQGHLTVCSISSLSVKDGQPPIYQKRNYKFFSKWWGRKKPAKCNKITDIFTRMHHACDCIANACMHVGWWKKQQFCIITAEPVWGMKVILLLGLHRSHWSDFPWFSQTASVCACVYVLVPAHNFKHIKCGFL